MSDFQQFNRNSTDKGTDTNRDLHLVSSAAREENFNKCGININFLKTYLRKLYLSYSMADQINFKLAGQHLTFNGKSLLLSPVLWVNPSDSLTSIYKSPSINGLKALTIAGSGDFPLVMIDRGVRDLTITDSSLCKETSAT